MAEATHREKAQTVGTLTTTITMVFHRACLKSLSWKSLAKLLRPMKLPSMEVSRMLASVRLVRMQMTMGMMTNPAKKIKLGSMKR